MFSDFAISNEFYESVLHSETQHSWNSYNYSIKLRKHWTIFLFVSLWMELARVRERVNTIPTKVFLNWSVFLSIYPTEIGPTGGVRKLRNHWQNSCGVQSNKSRDRIHGLKWIFDAIFLAILNYNSRVMFPTWCEREKQRNGP